MCSNDSCQKKVWQLHKAAHEALEKEQKKSSAPSAEQDCDSPLAGSGSSNRRHNDNVELLIPLIQSLTSFGRRPVTTVL